MQQSRKSVPTWILLISGILAIMEIGAGVALFAAPDFLADTVDLGARGVYYLIQVWATRQLAIGILFAYATWKKSPQMLTAAYIFLLMMFVGDLVIGFIHGENTLIISAVVMCILSAVMLYAINKKRP